jgi:hypothetical protein
MLRYLKAAFFLRPGVPGLGGLPINLMGLAGFGIAGFAHPGFWLLGAGLETVYLFVLSTNARFRRVIDGQLELRMQEEANEYRDTLVNRLSAAMRRRLTDLEQKYGRIKKLYQDRELPDYLVDTNRNAMRKLLWTYLKLLLARATLDTEGAWASEAELHRQVQEAERELDDPRLGAEVRESKQATLEILRRRLENRDRRAQSLKEIDSDLTRIEAQVDLALENAAIPSREPSVATNIQLASRLLDQGAYGDSGVDVAALEARYDMINRFRESGKERAPA